MAENLSDPRWGDRIPWYLRHSGGSVTGHLDKWLDLVGQRLERFFVFNEGNLTNVGYFGPCLESETLGRFKSQYNIAVSAELSAYFRPVAVSQEADSDTVGDREEREAQELARKVRISKAGGGGQAPNPQDVFRAEMHAHATRARRRAAHWGDRFKERISTLEAVLGTVTRLGGSADGMRVLIADLRRICAATNVPLDIRGSPALIFPIEDVLLQQAVIEPLLSRLSARWPDRARELMAAYHDVIAGKPLDEVFSSAFKTVEEIARTLTGNAKFEFSESDVSRHFPSLHPTIKAGITKLRAHRGDAAAHGRKAPDPNEIRFLLFQLCNLALLLLDVPVERTG